MKTNVKCILAASFALMSMVGLLAQTPQQQARIDFEAGKKSLAEGDASSALKRFESVIATLGSMPEIEIYAAKAAVAMKDWPTAQKHVKAAFATSDKQFEKSPAYQNLIALAADVDIALKKAEKRAQEEVAPTEFVHARGAFTKDGFVWTETNEAGPRFTFRFLEKERDFRYIFAFDSSRGMWLRLPLKGGFCSVASSKDGPWMDLYQVSRGN